MCLCVIKSGEEVGNDRNKKNGNFQELEELGREKEEEKKSGSLQENFSIRVTHQVTFKKGAEKDGESNKTERE